VAGCSTVAIESRKQAAKAPQPAVAQCRIGFLLEQIRQLDILLRQRLFDGVVPAQVNQVIRRQAANQNSIEI